MRRYPWLWPLLLAVMVLGGWYSGFRARNDDRELPVYVMGGERMAAGEEIYRRGTDAKPFTYPPFSAVPFIPFAKLPATWQAPLWFVVNFSILLAIGVFLHRFGARTASGSGPPRLWLFWLLTALFGGHHVLSVFANQSHDLLIAGALALSAASWCRGSMMAGVWAGLGAAMKATPLLFLGLFGLRFRWSAVLATAGTFALLSWLPDLVFPRGDGRSWMIAWFDVNLRVLEAGGTASAAGAWNAHSYLNQSLSGTLTRLFTRAVVEGPFVDGGVALAHLDSGACKAITIAGQLAILLTLALAVVAATRRLRACEGTADRTAAQRTEVQRTGGFGEVAAFACGMVLLSPQSSKSHFCILLFPAAFLADRLLRGRFDIVLWLMVGAALLLGPLAAKDLIGRPLGNKLLAYGSLTWATVLLLLATVRAMWSERPVRSSP